MSDALKEIRQLPIKPRLRVIQKAEDSESNTAQDCARCPHMHKCWNMQKTPSDSVLTVNLLVCRLKLGIKPNRSAKLLLRMLRPKVIKTAQWILRSVHPFTVDLDEVIADLEAVCIETLLEKYELGGNAWPLRYLFGKPNGGVRVWAMKYANKVRREGYTHYQYGSFTDEDGNDLEWKLKAANARITAGRVMASYPGSRPLGSGAPAEAEPDPERDEQHSQAIATVEDGISLSLSEYRVMRFCLTHAHTFENPRSPITGLHGFLAAHTGVVRQNISRYYRNASYKLVEFAGLTEQTLRARNIDASVVDKARRKRWMYGVSLPEDRLTAEEIHGLLQAVKNAEDATLADICWAYGINDRSYYNLREKYEDATLEAIKDERDES